MPKKASEHGSYAHTSSAMKLVLVASAITGAIIAAFLIASAYVLTKLEVETVLFQPISTAAVSIATGISGYFTARICKKQYFLTGCAVGIGVFAIITLVFIISARDAITVRILYKLLALVAAGGAGGFTAAGSTGKTKHPAKPKAARHY